VSIRLRTSRFGIAVLALALAACDEKRPAPRTHHHHAPSVNPIDRMLRSAVNAPRQEGVAIVLLVDVSGSMGETVADAQGRPQQKIIIAKRCALDLIGKAEQYAAKNPERTIRLAVFEFSARDRQPSCRPVVGMGAPKRTPAEPAISRMAANGGTPIGDAMCEAKLALDATGLTRQHMMVVTDGENTHGFSPGDVAHVMLQRLPEDRRPALYFIAFDVASAKFKEVRDAGAILEGASNEAQLSQQFDSILTGRILVEAPPK